MAGAGTKLWVAGETVTAAGVNTYLQDQVVARFADATARTNAFGGAGEPTLAEGMLSYLDSDNTVYVYDGSAWKAVGLGSTIDAKGDLLVGTADDTVGRQAVGANGTFLIADSAQTNGVAWSEQSLGYRNVVINGAMQVAQRGTSTASITTGGYYTADRFNSQVGTQGTWTQSLEADAPTGSGFRKSLKMLCTTADASPAAGDFLRIEQLIEGQNLQQFLKGTASAKPFALSFWVKSNVTGTYIANLYDVPNNRLVGASYTIFASATWEKKTITFPADTTGAFANDNQQNLQVRFWLGAGSNRTSGTLNTVWETAVLANSCPGQTNLASAINNYWQVTGVQLEAGSVATPFEFEDYGTTLGKCQRYFLRLGGANAPCQLGHGTGDGSTNGRFFQVPTPVTLRATPTLTEGGEIKIYNSALTNRGFGATNNIQISANMVGFGVALTASTAGEFLALSCDTTSDFLDVSAEM